MKVAYLDTFAGISGDMTVGALVALGVPLDAVREALAALPISGYRLETRRVERSGIAAVKFDVVVEGDDHAHEHGHAHEGGHGHRPYAEIRRMLAEAPLAPGARERAERIFARLAEAEGRVHGVPADAVTFHEVGAIDSIADVVGAAVALDWLGVEQVASAPLPLGRGLAPSRHGPLPLPPPAVVELCRGLAVVAAPADAELVTPTGAAIVAALAGPGGVGPMPAMTVEAVGYGAGTREFPGFPNLLRVVVGEAAAPGADRFGRERAIVVETNLDDMNPQLFEPLAARLAEAGALDVTLTPVQMKKGRPGVTVQAICRPGDADRVAAALFVESTAIGVRTYEVLRATLRRTLRRVATPYGEVAVKVSGDRVVRNAQPEYEACRAAAAAHGVAVKAVHAAALAAALAAWPPGSPFPEGP
ncbi:MAG TPA: nickel pincer cofactor biosynthesis protein LarC [Thermodesulfobacteriota bacterium]